MYARYLALIVYANFAIEFITTVWWQDAHDEPDVQNARTEECERDAATKRSPQTHAPCTLCCCELA
jgi:hypothetical protein